MNGISETCQSCGMPLTAPGDRGTEGDGAPSAYYCRYCYQNGAFTDPEATIETMAARGGEMMSRMFEPPAGAGAGLRAPAAPAPPPLERPARSPPAGAAACRSRTRPTRGRRRTARRAQRYCTHCYRNGAFVEPDLTREAMIEEFAPLLAAELGMPLERATAMVTAFTATLPRWR